MREETKLTFLNASSRQIAIPVVLTQLQLSFTLAKKIANVMKEKRENEKSRWCAIFPNDSLLSAFALKCNKMWERFEAFLDSVNLWLQSFHKIHFNELSLQRKSNKLETKKKKIVKNAMENRETQRTSRKMTKDKNKEREKILTLLALCLRQQIYWCASWTRLLSCVGEILKDSDKNSPSKISKSINPQKPLFVSGNQKATIYKMKP